MNHSNMTTTSTETTSEHACCHTPAKTSKTETHAGAHAHATDGGAHAQHAAIGGWRGAAKVTLHCLTGCAIGEWIGLTIGVTLGLQTMHTIALAVVLAYASGFALTLIPLMRSGMRLAQAFKIVWVGEAISIAAMELVMNVVDYHMGGMRRGMSLLHTQYWIAFSAAAVAGYLAAWPVNYGMLKSSIKKACH